MENINIEKLRQEIREEVTAEVQAKYKQAFSDLDAQIRIVNEKEEICNNLIKLFFDKVSADRALEKAEQEIMTSKNTDGGKNKWE